MLGHSQQEVARDLRIKSGIEISGGLGGQNQREAELSTFGGESRQEAQATGAVGFVEDDGVGNSALNAAAEHFLVDVVEREHRHGSCTPSFCVA